MSRVAGRVVALLGALVAVGAGPADAAPAGFTLSTTQPGGPGFAPAFVGNGYLAGRQPAAGQGYDEVPVAGSDEPLATQSEVQGFYAKTSKPDEGLIERRAALPAWSTLSYDDGSGAYALNRGKVVGYRQSLDLHTGTLTTRVTWTSPGGRTAVLRYDVAPDRARPHAALVRLRITPRFTGTATVTDLLDGQAAESTRGAGTGHAGRAQWVDLRTRGLGIRATVASVLAAGRAAPVALGGTGSQTAGQRVRLHVRRGRTVTVIKFVGVAVSTDRGAKGTPHVRALRAARREAALGWARARPASNRAWAVAWRSDIAVAGDARLQREVRAAFFALLASLRDDVPWAPSPGGLSSDGYNGHVFWDSETWMYPTMLATEPGIARQMLRYRFDRLGAARANARTTGYTGARFPWESALSGAEETPSCCDTGKFEVHVNADIALAAWQYWLATGDRRWLRTRGWPLVSGIADFWVSRAVRNGDGSWSIKHVIPPDEYADGVDDSIYTNVSTRDALRIAGRVARLVGGKASPRWATVADHLRILGPVAGVHPEYQGYPGDTVKQADVTLLSYPWENPQSAAQTQRDLDYYVPRTDPGGPSMTDAIHSIVTSQLGTPGCAAFTFTRRSVDPFMRGPYEQFSESRSGGAFTFTTGAGGFLQEFLYGYSGLRWRGDRVQLDPSLPPQLRGITLSAVHWRGRTLRIAVRRASTRVTLRAGRALKMSQEGHAITLRPGGVATFATRKPDAGATSDIARCRPATAAPSTPEPAEAAVDGTDATTWQADAPATHVTVDLGRAVALGHVDVTRPPVLAIASPVKGKNAVTGPTHSAAETVQLSSDGRTWQTLTSVAAPTLHDSIDATGHTARYVRVVAGSDATAQKPLVVGELGVRAP